MEIFLKMPNKTERGILSSEKVYDLALCRLAAVFKVKKGELRPEMIFGEDLKSPKKRFFFSIEDNLIDVYEDVSFITTAVYRKNKEFFGDVALEEIHANTVDEYCKHMVRCYRVVPDLVESVLKYSPP